MYDDPMKILPRRARGYVRVQRRVRQRSISEHDASVLGGSTGLDRGRSRALGRSPECASPAQAGVDRADVRPVSPAIRRVGRTTRWDGPSRATKDMRWPSTAAGFQDSPVTWCGSLTTRCTWPCCRTTRAASLHGRRICWRRSRSDGRSPIRPRSTCHRPRWIRFPVVMSRAILSSRSRARGIT